MDRLKQLLKFFAPFIAIVVVGCFAFSVLIYALVQESRNEQRQCTSLVEYGGYAADPVSKRCALVVRNGIMEIDCSAILHLKQFEYIRGCWALPKSK